MQYLSRVLYDIFDKPFYSQWEFWTGFLSVVLLIWTVSETIKLRKETQRANWLSIRPTLSFRTSLGRYSVFNPSAQIAFNIFALLRDGACYKLLKDGMIIGAMESKDERVIEHNSWLDLNKSEVLNKVGSIAL